jgi:hypothetical protein
VAPSLDHTQQPTSSGAQLVLQSGSRRGKLYSEVVKKDDFKRYRITLTPKDEALSPDQIKSQLKRNINPTEIKVGIKAIKTIRNKGLTIETGSEEELNIHRRLTLDLESSWKSQNTDYGNRD